MAFKMENTTPASRRSRAATGGQTLQEESEFAGLWVNVGVDQVAADAEKDPETGEYRKEDVTFARLPRGIAVSDLKEHKLYASSNPEWAAEAQLVNSIINLIRERGLELEEGESIPINLSCRIYRRQEQVEQVADRKTTSSIESQLFG